MVEQSKSINIRIWDGDEPVAEHKDSGAVVTIGRSDDNTIVLDARNVSRKHACIEVSGDAMSLVDLSSSNGIFLNGERIATTPVVLRDMDKVKIGDFILTFGDQALDDAIYEKTVATTDPNQGMARALESLDDPTQRTNVRAKNKSSSYPKDAPTQRRKMRSAVSLSSAETVEYRPESPSLKPWGVISSSLLVALTIVAWAGWLRQPDVSATDEDTQAHGMFKKQQPSVQGSAVEQLAEIEAAIDRRAWLDAETLVSASVLDASRKHELLVDIRSEQRAALAIDEARRQKTEGQLWDAWKTLENVPVDSRYASQAQNERKTLVVPLSTKTEREFQRGLVEQRKDVVQKSLKKMQSLGVEPRVIAQKRKQLKRQAAVLSAKKEASLTTSELESPVVEQPNPPKVNASGSEQNGDPYRAAVDALSQGRLKEAVSALKRCLTMDPAACSCHRTAGIAYRRLGDVAKSDEHYKEYLNLCPNAPDVEKIEKLVSPPAGGSP